MKKAISFSLVWGMIFLPCLSISAQRSVLKGTDSSSKDVKRPAKKPASANQFEVISAASSGAGALVRWRMVSETANIGFYVHRVDQNSDTVVNEEIIFGSAAKSGRYPLVGEEYSFFDGGGNPRSSYFVETLDLDGARTKSKVTATRFSKLPVEDPNPSDDGTGGSKARSASFQQEQVNVSKEIQAEIDRFTSSTPDPDKHKWVISHSGVRVDVKTEGIYRVPFAQIAAAGFDINSDKSLWQMYRNGIEQAIRIDDAGSYIEFYGKGVDTPESEIQGYFLINGDTAGKRIDNIVERPSTSSIIFPSYNQTSIYKERNIYIDTILNGPAENYFGGGLPTGGRNVQFDLKDIDFNSPNSTLEIKAQGFSTGLHTLQVTLNGQLLAPVTGGVSQFSFSGTQTISTSILKDAALGQGTNTLNLASVGPSGDFSLFDSVKVTFAKKHKATQDTLKAYTARSRKTAIGGFSSSNVRVYDITFENDPRLIINLPFTDQGGTFGAELGSTRARVFFAADESKIQAPFAVTPNDGEVLSTPTLGANLIIITFKDLQAKADMWANYRTGQGFSVKVVDINEIFNEFGYGVSSSDSIEAFLNYAYNNWATQPQYVLMMGDATRDPRNYTGAGYFNYVPTRMVTTVFTETGSDEALADFNDDGLSEIAIGRIPARLPAEIDNVYQKVFNWETNLGADPLSRGTLFAVDQFDATNNIDFAAITERIKAELPETVSKTTVNRTQPNAQADLVAAFNTGKYIVNYTGHGATGTWAATSFFWSGTVSQLTNDNSESISTMLTCLNGYFLFPVGEGLAETMLNYPSGGSVATWASTGLTTPDDQEPMAKRFYRKIGEGSIPRLGDLIKDAKTVVVGRTDVRLSWSLLGDPMLKVR